MVVAILQYWCSIFTIKKLNECGIGENIYYFKQHIRERKKTKITIRITVPINSNKSGINSLVLRIGEETKILVLHS